MTTRRKSYPYSNTNLQETLQYESQKTINMVRSHFYVLVHSGHTSHNSEDNYHQVIIGTYS